MQKGFIQFGVIIVMLIAITLIGGASYITHRFQSSKTEVINQEAVVPTQISDNTNDAKIQDENKQYEHALVPNNAILCNGTYYTQCIDSLKFVCPKTGEAYCETPLKNNSASVAANTLLCNGKEWLKCPEGYNFYCPAQGDARCVPQPSVPANAQVNTSVSNRAYLQQVESLMRQEIDKQNSWFEEYLRKQAEIDEKLKPINEEWDRVMAQIKADCPIAFYTGQKAFECDQLTNKLNSLNAEASRISGIYPERKALPQFPYPSYQQWRFDTMRDGLSGTIWSPNSTTRYLWSCVNPYSCTLTSY